MMNMGFSRTSPSLIHFQSHWQKLILCRWRKEICREQWMNVNRAKFTYAYTTSASATNKHLTVLPRLYEHYLLLKHDVLMGSFWRHCELLLNDCWVGRGFTMSCLCFMLVQLQQLWTQTTTFKVMLLTR